MFFFLNHLQRTTSGVRFLVFWRKKCRLAEIISVPPASVFFAVLSLARSPFADPEKLVCKIIRQTKAKSAPPEKKLVSNFYVLEFFS